MKHIWDLQVCFFWFGFQFSFETRSYPVTQAGLHSLCSPQAGLKLAEVFCLSLARAEGTRKSLTLCHSPKVLPNRKGNVTCSDFEDLGLEARSASYNPRHERSCLKTKKLKSSLFIKYLQCSRIDSPGSYGPS